jgi:hypothetical protein
MVEYELKEKKTGNEIPPVTPGPVSTKAETKSKVKSKTKDDAGKPKTKRAVKSVKRPGTLRTKSPSRKTPVRRKVRTTKVKGKTTQTTKKPVKSAKVKEEVSTTPVELKWVEEDPRDHLLSRFIYDSKNKVIGESIGVEGKQLIMKSGKYFYSIPLKKIHEKENDLTLKGKVNRQQARKLGEAWRKRTLDPLYQKKKK